MTTWEREWKKEPENPGLKYESSETVIFIEKSDHRRGKHEGIRHPNYYKNLGGKKFEGKRNYICGKCNAGFSNKGSMLHHVCGSKKGTQWTKIKNIIWILLEIPNTILII